MKNNFINQVNVLLIFLFADYNSIVKKGDIVAKIEPELYKSDLEEGNARLKTALANLESISKNISYAEAKVKRAGADRSFEGKRAISYRRLSGTM